MNGIFAWLAIAPVATAAAAFPEPKMPTYLRVADELLDVLDRLRRVRGVVENVDHHASASDTAARVPIRDDCFDGLAVALADELGRAGERRVHAEVDRACL